MGFVGVPNISDHAYMRISESGFTMKQITATLNYGLGIVETTRRKKHKNRKKLVGPELTLILNDEFFIIVTVYENRFSHRRVA